LGVNNAVLTPAVDALISLDNVRLEVVALIRTKLLRRAEGSLASSTYCWYTCKRRIETFTSLTLPPERLVNERLLKGLAVLHDGNDRVKGVVIYEAIELTFL
jgi:hypothetical protein